jgi:hypothetical protein
MMRSRLATSVSLGIAKTLTARSELANLRALRAQQRRASQKTAAKSARKQGTPTFGVPPSSPLTTEHTSGARMRSSNAQIALARDANSCALAHSSRMGHGVGGGGTRGVGCLMSLAPLAPGEQAESPLSVIFYGRSFGVLDGSTQGLWQVAKIPQGFKSPTASTRLCELMPYAPSGCGLWERAKRAGSHLGEMLNMVALLDPRRDGTVRSQSLASQSLARPTRRVRPSCARS